MEINKKAKSDQKAKEKEILQNIKKARKGDEESYNYLLNLVEPEIKKLQCQGRLWVFGYEECDIFNECCIMLLKAIKNFDPKRCKNFKFYTKILFRGRIVSLIQESKRYKNVTLNVSTSLDYPVFEDDEGNTYSLYDLIPDGEELLSEKIERKEYCSSLKSKIFEDLTKKEKEVFELYLEDLSYEEISQKLKIDTKSVDNAIQRAKNKIPNIMKEEISDYEDEKNPVVGPKKRMIVLEDN